MVEKTVELGLSKQDLGILGLEMTLATCQAVQAVVVVVVVWLQ